MLKRETMEEGMHAAPYEKDAVAADPAAEHTDEQDEGGNAVYDMFCALPPEEQTRVLGMIKQKHASESKQPFGASDDREFRPLAKGEV